MKNGKQVNCIACGKQFYITPSRFSNKTHSCSKRCSGIGSSLIHSKKIKTNCVICDTEIYYKQSHFKKIASPCCSRSCSGKMRSIRNLGKGNPKSLNLTKIEHIFWDRTNQCRYRAESKNIEFNLDYLFLYELFKKQDGKCHYTGLPMSLKGSLSDKDSVFSVDKIDAKAGYTKDNVVLCLNSINRLKGDNDLKALKDIFRAIFENERTKTVVKVKKLSQNSKLPIQGKPGDAGFDLTATSITENNKLYIEYSIDLAISLEPGFVGLIYARSSLSNYDLILSNHVGIIDENYRGCIKFRFKKTSESPDAKYYKVGDKIGQLIVMPYPKVEFEQVDELDETVRGEQGFGSSGV